MRQALYGVGLMTIVFSLATTLSAGAPVVPEVDSSSLTVGLGLLTGAVLILRSQWGARKRAR